jgi:hypothetical protein
MTASLVASRGDSPAVESSGRQQCGLFRAFAVHQEPMDRDAEAGTLGNHRRVPPGAGRLAVPGPFSRMGFLLRSRHPRCSVNRHVDATRRAGDNHEVLSNLAYDQPADDALGQPGTVPTSIASDDDAHSYSKVGRVAPLARIPPARRGRARVSLCIGS